MATQIQTIDPEYDDIDERAAQLSRGNEVELCWVLRGMAAKALLPESYWAEDSEAAIGYRGYWSAGFRAVQPGDVVTETAARNVYDSLNL